MFDDDVILKLDGSPEYIAGLRKEAEEMGELAAWEKMSREGRILIRQPDGSYKRITQ